jgi:divalent metal cation (Fe/Co/Zn/Cd) transporter
VFFIDHRNDIVVNSFGLIMSIVGTRLVWWLDPLGAILIGLLILCSWAATAFEQVWLLVGKSAPREFISKVLYVSLTHDDRIRSIDTVGWHSRLLIFFSSDCCDSVGLITLERSSSSRLT